MEFKFNKNNVWLGMRFAVLPALLIPPFWLTKYMTAKCFKSSVSTIHLVGPSQKVMETGLHSSSNPKYFGILLWTLLISFLIVSFLQIGPKKYRLRFDHAKQQIAVAVVSTCVTLPVYAYMNRWSQYRFPPNWSCGADGILRGGLNAQARFGLGLAPIVAVVIVALYLSAPLTALLVTRPKSGKLWESK